VSVAGPSNSQLRHEVIVVQRDQQSETQSFPTDLDWFDGFKLDTVISAVLNESKIEVGALGIAALNGLLLLFAFRKPSEDKDSVEDPNLAMSLSAQINEPLSGAEQGTNAPLHAIAGLTWIQRKARNQ